jgi:hypothetical protein
VPGYLNNGYTLGACGSAAFEIAGEVDNSNIGQPGQVQPAISNDFSVLVSPNPTSTDFKIQVKSGSIESFAVRILDDAGRILSISKKVPKGTILSAGRDLKPGTYFAEIIQGENKKTIKLVKLN